jgi:hypothetical protein
VPVPIFSCFCILEKLYRKYSRNWTEQSPKSLFCCHVHGVQRRDGGGHRGSHTRWWHPWPRHHMVWAPRAPSDLTLFAINCHPQKTLNSQASIHEKFCSAAAIKDQFRGIEVSILAPCRDGELPLEPSPSTSPPSSSLLLTPMMRRE